MNELGRNHVLEKLVSNFRGRNDRSHWKMTLSAKQDIANQKRLPCILLTDHNNHRTFATIDFTSVCDHLHIKLSKLKVHLVQSKSFFCLCGTDRCLTDKVS